MLRGQLWEGKVRDSEAAAAGAAGDRKGTTGNPRSLSFFSGPWEGEEQRRERGCAPLSSGLERCRPAEIGLALSLVPGTHPPRDRGFPGNRGGCCWRPVLAPRVG